MSIFNSSLRSKHTKMLRKIPKELMHIAHERMMPLGYILALFSRVIQLFWMPTIVLNPRTFSENENFSSCDENSHLKNRTTLLFIRYSLVLFLLSRLSSIYQALANEFMRRWRWKSNTYKICSFSNQHCIMHSMWIMSEYLNKSIWSMNLAGLRPTQRYPATHFISSGKLIYLQLLFYIELMVLMVVEQI